MAEAEFEWEDAAADEWEVLIADDDAEAAQDTHGNGQDIVVELEDPGAQKKRVQRVVITKERRLLCQAVHRVHLLCLLARLRLHDGAASSDELQARMLSLLQPQHLPVSFSPTTADPKRSIAHLKQLLSWFNSTFALAAYANEEDHSATVASLADGALRVKAAPAEVLVVLFVALMRGLGLLVRYVLLLDVLPLEPWRKAAPKPLRLVSVHEARAKEQAHSKRQAQQKAAVEAAGGSEGAGDGGLDDEVEEAVRLLVAGADDIRAYTFSTLMDDLGEQLPHFKYSKAQREAIRKLYEAAVDLATEGLGPASRQRKRGRGANKAASADAGDARGQSGGEDSVALGAGDAPAAKKAKTGRRAKAAVSNGASAGKAAPKEGAAGARAGRAAGTTAKRDGAQGDGSSGADTSGQRPAGTKRKPNLGEQEFDRELQLALMATAAEAEARELRRMNEPEAPGKPAEDSGPSSAAPRVKGLKTELFGRTRGGKAAAGGRGKTLGASGSAGQVLGSRSGLVPCVWAEVYCGTAETGRWVHVDVLNGLVDKPETVEAATQRSTPAAYIVACSAGVAGVPAPAASPAQASKPSSSSHTVSEQQPPQALEAPQELKDVTNRYVGSFLALQKLRDNAWWEATMALLSGSTPSHQLPTVPLPSPDPGAGPSSSAQPALKPSGLGRGAQAQVKEQQQQQQPSGGSNSNPGGLNAVPSADLLRAKREDAELHQRAVSQLQGLPTSVDGFKAHPTYLLKRHITKYEALRPGAAVLGTHRGEPFYARASVSDLHTVERWRREGREVRTEELGKPCKVVAKRKQPPPPGERRGGGYGGYGGYNRWARSGGAASSGGGGRKSSKSRGAAADDLDDDDLGEGPSQVAGDDGGPTVDLYGDWQTEPWVRPVAVDGKVPKNERGNVECPPLVKALPMGTVHLQYPGIWTVCRSLNVDYGPALVGFEVQAGRMLPKIDGVVVCEEFEHQVVAAYLERETAKQEALAARRRREATSAWIQLLQAMRTRLQLQSSYEQDPAAAAPRQTPARQDTVDLTCADDEEAAAPEPSQMEQKLAQLREAYEKPSRGQGAGNVTGNTGMDVEEF